MSRLRDAYLYYGRDIARFGVNRRNNKASEIETLFEFKGPIDYSVPVLFARFINDNSPFVIVFYYACHGTVLADYQWCGDYPGFAQIELQSIYPGSNAIFLAGCGEDIDPMPRLKFSLARQYGKELTCGVQRVIDNNFQQVPAFLKTGLEMVKLELEQPLTKEELEQVATDPTQVDYKFRSAKYILRELSNCGGVILICSTYNFPI